MNKIYRITLLLLLIAIHISVITAQPIDPPVDTGGGTVVGGGAGVPLDGGALELLLAGFVYIGFSKTKTWLRKRKSSRNEG